MHTDEAVHAVKLGELLDTGDYIYDPQEYHGPTLYYLAAPLVWLSGADSFATIASEIPLRLVPVLFGTGLVLLLVLVSDGLGRAAAVIAGVLTAVSPAMVYYSRYYIQEMLLVFFTFALIAALWRYSRTRSVGWVIAAGAALGLMFATKETAIIALAAMLGAGLLTLAWARSNNRRASTPPSETAVPTFDSGQLARHGGLALAVAATVAALCLTALFSNPAAVPDAFGAYMPYISRAFSGESATSGLAVHNHPWYFYLRMLAFTKDAPGPWWSEALILSLALAGLIAALGRKHQPESSTHLLRFLAFYTILMTVAYSIIPYKTPWCMLGFLHGMILMAGVGAVALYRWLPGRAVRVVAGVLFLAGTYQLGLQAYDAAYRFAADGRNPYAYAHTSTSYRKLVTRIEDIAEVHEAGTAMRIDVVAPDDDYWPLPWSLRRFSQVGYYNTLPGDLDAPMIIAAIEYEKVLSAQLGDTYQVDFVGLRPDVLMLSYTRRDLWDVFIEGRR